VRWAQAPSFREDDFTGLGSSPQCQDRVVSWYTRRSEGWTVRLKIRATFTCPFCNEVIPNQQLKLAGPMTCPNCSRRLRYSRWQLRLSGLIALGLTVAFCWALGLRGLWLFVAAIVLWFPVYVVSDVIFLRIVPPKFEAY